jgi:hypothetical protein
VQQGGRRVINDQNATLSATCTVSQCGREFSFVPDDTQIFDLPVPLFERRHFYRSELLPSA